MPMQKHELDQISKEILKHPEGISSTELCHILPKIGYRTLLRRLEKLLAEGKIIKKGRTRSVSYKPYLSDKIFSPVQQRSGSELLLSSVAMQLQSSVHKTLSEKKVVYYHVKFQEKYQPNISYYLTLAERQYLQAIGQHGEKKQPAGTFARKILHRFLIDLSWNSSRLEGNTYSLLETDKLLFEGKAAKSKTTLETQMLLNHKSAIEFMVESSDMLAFNPFTIFNLHAFLSDGLLGDPSASGRLRTISVHIYGTSYHPLNIPQLIEENFNKLLVKASKIKDPFEQAFFVLVHIPYLQPFEDVNKRVSRLAANIPFFKNNLYPVSFIEVDEKNYIDGLLAVYEINRIELLKEVFIWAYERSTRRYTEIQQLLGEPDPFRLKYRAQIYDLVKQIIINNFSKDQAIKSIRAEANKQIPVSEQAKFMEIVENELRSIHFGNFARFHITPKQFERWQKQW